MGAVARGWGESKGVQNFVHHQGLTLMAKTNNSTPGASVCNGFVSHAKHIIQVLNNTTISL
jgi:hypothetical protein